MTTTTVCILPNIPETTYKLANLGIPMNVLPAGTKASNLIGWQDSCTTSAEEIANRIRNSDSQNYACVAKAEPGGFLFLDDDGGIIAEYEKQYGPLPATLKAQSCNGSYHYYLQHSAASLAYQSSVGKAFISEHGDEKGELWSLRMHNAYVVGPGSVVPNDAGVNAEYKIVEDAPVIEIPDTLLSFLVTRHDKKNRKDGKKPLVALYEPIGTGERNVQLARRAGLMRRIGLDETDILRVLTEINQTCCDQALDQSEIETIAHSIGNKPVEEFREEDPEETINCSSSVFSSLTGNWINGYWAGEKVPDYVLKLSVVANQDVVDWHNSFRGVHELEQGEPRMLIDNFLIEGTTFIGALPGEGKTLFALSLCKALTTGQAFLGRKDFTVPAIVPVIYMIPESSARAFRKRCEKFGIPKDRKLFLCRTISEGGTLRLDDPALLAAIREMKPVVILDTVIRFSQSDDENSATKNKQLADDIVTLRQAGAIAVIPVHHSTKVMREKGMSLESVLRGTGDLAALADGVYGLLRNDSIYKHGSGPNEIEVACVKARDFHPPALFRIAATRKADKPTIIGVAPGIVSTIDEEGDFRIVMSEAASHKASEKVAEVDTAQADYELIQAAKREIEKAYLSGIALNQKELATLVGITSNRTKERILNGGIRPWKCLPSGRKNGAVLFIPEDAEGLPKTVKRTPATVEKTA